MEEQIVPHRVAFPAPASENIDGVFESAPVVLLADVLDIGEDSPFLKVSEALKADGLVLGIHGVGGAFPGHSG